jgi:hypothetical protein
MDEFFISVCEDTDRGNMDSQSRVEQKLDYIHLNPMHERWNLVE